ncbi:tetratricopeptide repeat protein [Longimicrobium sp.]|uniref:tetratricopeptide repeat protein n=1 Tax=Longimicrobium sp. TaxID=2029185 RepID=UPI002E33B751|nr:tetratricopeptide repeat protein [Longimicrobium sp.]HEX6039998.1 tetratricopeptide repeat protein [Longimicrobium sp.]
MDGLEEEPRRRRPRRKTRRRWCLPPAIIREPGEMLEAAQVLQEHEGTLALVLWTAVRDVTLWAAAAPERRATLFSPQAEAARRDALRLARAEPALELSLTTLASVVSHAAQASPPVVSLVCVEVARWARQRGSMGTAVAFAQAAAFALPEAPQPALVVGQLTVEWGRDRRAETWLRRAIGLARRVGDWETYGAAYVALGEVYVRTGRMEAAPRYFQQAARLARRQGYRYIRGEALHGLVRTSLAEGDLDAAEEYARTAQRAYGPAHARLPELHHDVARLLMARGHHERAGSILRRLASVFTDPARRADVHALLAYAAALLGEARPYERAWTEAWALLDAPAAAGVAPGVLRHLGHAAALRHDWLRVQQVVDRAGELGLGSREEFESLRRRLGTNGHHAGEAVNAGVGTFP